MKNLVLMSLLILIGLASCNTENEFPDFKYQTVYFAYQYPVRTITLGEDTYVNTDLDNAHKCQIYATTGGVYESRKDVSIKVAVDNSLLKNGLLFGAGKDEVLPMPSNYFTLGSDKIIIPKGTLAGGVDVQLTDAFFADPKSIKNTYVIPLTMTSVTDADSILYGKHFVLYAIKYVNPWHGNYLRRGKDVVTGTVNQTVVRHAKYVESDEVNKLTTKSLSELEFPVVFKDKDNKNVSVTLSLKFEGDGKCTIASATSGYTATGSGAFVKKGEKNSWGNKDRDALYLKYEVNVSGMKISTSDTLVMRDRTVTMETFSPVAK
ncbi:MULTISPECIES: DUF5627 domain-containing protein [Arcicella]|uniref:DUF5627 domain-containing protein n=1 Tax=Arcicella lustrica TaxID=2984196 RepID=A0ABU5SKA5_9BACT|nr:DUF5627 domain-containing protein [Arcicella sp. DC25W]MEA5427732.1 DUF5627 domain-containing protein [Arcicella sp. DC25W]|eukprot:GDKJ01020629.1.p1 GENE.GDKJ01020629.1~~GDKJ01020629.1.p1  ORF type:complete len:320 (-),score=20.86 GDKJ01020629.1:506-1465(-)